MIYIDTVHVKHFLMELNRTKHCVSVQWHKSSKAKVKQRNGTVENKSLCGRLAFTANMHLRAVGASKS